MNRIKTIIISLAVISALPGLAQQKTWSLEECIRYAIENNIRIRQQEIQTRYQENSLDLAYGRLLPTINGQASHNFSFNRTLDQTTYQYVDQNGQTDQFFLGGNLPLFTGFQNLNTIRKSRYDLLSGEQDLQVIKDNVALSVALDYLQILLNRELVAATDNQLQITLQQIDKTKKLVEAGSTARGNLLQIEAQAAQEEVQLINIRNLLESSYLNLTQLLELQAPAGFEITVPQISIDSNYILGGTVEDIFLTAQGTRPEVKSAELKLRSSEYQLLISRGGALPRLTMNHTFSTMYSNIRKKILGIDPVEGPVYGKYPFSEQLNDNINYGLGFILQVPILNGWQVTKSISNSRLGIENSKYSLEDTRKQLYKNIQQAYADAAAALKKFNASKKAVTSAEESFRYSEQRFNVGLVTPVDYNAAKTQLLRAQSELAQAKYEFVFKTKVLDFYKGVPLTLPK